MNRQKFGIIKLINQETWLKLFVPKSHISDDSIFKFQVIDIHEIDKSKLVFKNQENFYLIEQGKILLLLIDVINLSHQTKQQPIFLNEILIQDSYGSTFSGFFDECLIDHELTTDFSFRLIPKIKTRVSKFFLLPDELSEYFLKIRDYYDTTLNIV